MPTKKAADPSGPMVHVRDWISQQAALPAEALAGFVHGITDPWDTAGHWMQRWEAWLHQGHGH